MTIDIFNLVKKALEKKILKAIQEKDEAEKIQAMGGYLYIVEEQPEIWIKDFEVDTQTYYRDEWGEDECKKIEGLASYVVKVTQEFIGEINCRTYISDREEYLELHANHTLWNIRLPVSDLEYSTMVESYAERFEEETGVGIYLLGRSGRHVCVECNEDNLMRYEELQDKALQFELEIMETCNNMAGGGEIEE